MEKEFQVMVEGRTYTVVASDDQAVLLAAKAAGRAVLGLYDGEHPEEAPFGTAYLAERGMPVSESFLERIVRRHIGLPWRIAETKRLIIREFIPEDWEYLDNSEKETFGQYQGFLAYIRNQYPFYEYGMWAVEEKEEQRLIGTAGVKNLETGQAEREGTNAEEKETETGRVESAIGREETDIGGEESDIGRVETDTEAEESDTQGALEIGYRIHRPFRRRGYGREAAEAVVRYAEENLPYPLYARIREDNIPSRCLAEQIGFMPADCCGKTAGYGLSGDYTPVEVSGFTGFPEENGTRIRRYRYGRS